jgi:hypothetical protein
VPLDAEQLAAAVMRRDDRILERKAPAVAVAMRGAGHGGRCKHERRTTTIR